jgi:hypothetical protein
MKRDVTRSGVRTQRGAMDDAISGARRYFANNLRDLRRQLGIDVLLGWARYSDLVPGLLPHATDTARVQMLVYAPKAYREGYFRRVIRAMTATQKGIKQPTGSLKKEKLAAENLDEGGCDILASGGQLKQEEPNATQTPECALEDVLTDVIQHLEKLLHDRP